MSTILKSTSADFAEGVGYNQFPLVAQGNLVLAYDFSDNTNWKTAIAGGFTATAKVHDYVGHTTTTSDAGVAQPLNKKGLRVLQNGFVDFGYSMPQFSNNDAVGKTFMVLAGTTPYVPTGSTWVSLFSAGWQFSTAGIRLGEEWVASGLRVLGAAVQAVSQAAKLSVNYAMCDQANLIFLRANGDGTWDFIVPNLRAKYSATDAQIGVSDPVVMNLLAGQPGLVQMGNPLNSSTAAAREFDVYINGIWSRKLTDAEIVQQYQRLRLKFRGILN